MGIQRKRNIIYLFGNPDASGLRHTDIPHAVNLAVLFHAVLVPALLALRPWGLLDAGIPDAVNLAVLFLAGGSVLGGSERLLQNT